MSTPIFPLTGLNAAYPYFDSILNISLNYWNFKSTDVSFFPFFKLWVIVIFFGYIRILQNFSGACFQNVNCQTKQKETTTLQYT